MRIYENPEKTSENRLPPRSAYIPGGCSEYILLNGQWRFAYYDRDIDVPEIIGQWDTIPVPGCWQLYGYDSPNYTNQNFPFPVDMPYVPARRSAKGSLSCRHRPTAGRRSLWTMCPLFAVWAHM